MKIVLNIFCWILAVFCCWFPFAYNHSLTDRQEVKISHILVDSKDKALEIKERIQNGENFEELASQYSKCPSNINGGDLGYNMRGRLVKNFEDAAFNADLNTVSEPIETPYGWHILKITDIKYFSDKANLGKRMNIIKYKIE